MSEQINRQIRVLIADDHDIVRGGLATIVNFQSDMTVVGEAANGTEAVELFDLSAPDVTLMDLRMPKMDGVAAINAIRARYPKAGIIVLTTFDGDEDIFRALKAGARGYLLKDAGRNQLFAAIRFVSRGDRFVPADIASKLAERIGGNELTARELEVLRGIIEGLANKEIAAHLGIAEGTVKIHLNNIFSKLNVTDRTQAALTAIRRGILHL